MVRRRSRSTTPTRTRPSGSPWPASWRTPATWAWCRSPSTSARRCSTSTSGRSGSACPPGCRCPAPAPACWCRRPSGGATSGTPSPSARVSRPPRCRWPASTRPSPTAGSGCSRPSWRARPARTGGSCPRRAPHRQRVLQPTTAAELIGILQQVPYLDATLAYQPWGEIPGYSIASKTGTAQVWDPSALPVPVRVELHRHGARQRPASSWSRSTSRTRSAGDYFGNYVAGPVFYHVMKFALQTLKIPPDQGQASQRPAHRAVISGSLCPCLRICVHPAPGPPAGRARRTARRGQPAGGPGPDPLHRARRPADRVRRHPRLAPGPCPATCTPRCPAATTTGPSSARTRPRPARWPSSPTRRGRAAARRCGLPVFVVADPRARLGEVADWVYRHPSGRLLLIGVTGTSGKTTTTYLLETGLRRAGHLTGLVGRGGDPGRGTVTATSQPHHAGGHRPAGAVRRHGRARRHGGGDGGVQPRAGARPGGRDLLRRGDLHQPVPGPPGLPRQPRRRTSPRRPPCSRRPTRGWAW